MGIIKTHHCKRPAVPAVQVGDLYRCEECETLWKLGPKGWYDAPLWDYFRYRNEGYK